MFSKLAGPLIKVGVPLAKRFLPSLATMVPASAIDDAIQRKMYGRRVVRPRKGIILVITNEDMDDIIRIIKSHKNS